MNIELKENERLIKLYAREVELDDGRSFLSFKAVKKNGSLITAKFRRDCNRIPTGSCYIKVSLDDINENRNKEYPELWITHVLDIYPLEEVEANKRQEYKKQLAEEY